MSDDEDVVNALRALGETEGWERPGRAFAEAVKDVWEQRYLHARKLRPWVSPPGEESFRPPVWAKTLSEYLDHAQIFPGDDGQFLVAAHLYDVDAAWWMEVEHLCRTFGVEWRISAQSWYFPTGSLLVEIAPKLEGLNISTWHGLLNLDDAQMAEETAQRNRKRLRLVRSHEMDRALEAEERLSEEERRKLAAIKRMAWPPHRAFRRLGSNKTESEIMLVHKLALPSLNASFARLYVCSNGFSRGSILTSANHARFLSDAAVTHLVSLTPLPVPLLPKRLILG